MNRAKLAPGSALRGCVAMAIPLVVGALTGQLLIGVTVASPGPVRSAPALRETHLELVDRLRAADRGTGDNPWSDGPVAVLAGETDVVVDAVNSLCHLLDLDAGEA